MLRLIQFYYKRTLKLIVMGLPIISIGQSAIVNSVVAVTNVVPSYTIVVGIPAKLIRHFSIETEEKTDLRSQAEKYD